MADATLSIAFTLSKPRIIAIGDTRAVAEVDMLANGEPVRTLTVTGERHNLQSEWRIADKEQK